eukprot:4416601-Pyramimonas_sp.AAC.1
MGCGRGGPRGAGHRRSVASAHPRPPPAAGVEMFGRAWLHEFLCGEVPRVVPGPLRAPGQDP